MLPIVTPEEMGAIDSDATEPVEVLIGRAGAAVARAAMAMLGGGYGRRVVVVAGKGNNGADGREAARLLAARGVRVAVVDAAVVAPDERLDPADLVIDAAYGTGFRGTYDAPAAGAPVLAVDIPSGVDGLTGAAGEGAVSAARTVTFAALKPGLVLQPGRERAGAVAVADIGLDCSRATAHLVTATDVATWLPSRPVDSHKWKAAVWVVGGSPGMTGAPALAARGAQRGGAGYVRASTPGADPGAPSHLPTEAVGFVLPGGAWAATVVDGAARFGAVVVGPGLGTADGTAAEVRALVAGCAAPVVVDGDGLTALGRGWHAPDGRAVVLTPHDGEAERLMGAAPGADRFAAARGLAAATGAVVLLKGPTTVVAAPGGAALAVTTGDARLATAGTGDVLAGVVAALLAQGLAPLRAAATAAWLHGRAGTLGPARGLVAGDLPELLLAAYETLERPDDGQQLSRP